MEAKDLQRYQNLLLEMRDRSRDEVNRMIDVVLDDAEALGEHDRTVSESVDKEIVLEHTEETMRKAVLDALERIEQGAYGQCLECGGRIPKRRLDVIPFAAYCIKCQRESEREGS